MTQPATTCTTCHRKGPPIICDPCRTTTHNNLHMLPTLLGKLHVTLIGGTHPAGEQVGRTRLGPKPPTNTTVLALITTTTQALHRQQTFPTPPDRHQISLPQWVVAWAGVWRQRADHHTPVVARVQHRWSELNFNTRPHPTRSITPPTNRTLYVDLTYLQTRLDHACDQFGDTVDFIRQLRTLTATASAAVGEPSESVYLGDCPEPCIDPRTRLQKLTPEGEPAWCGAPLYHHPDDGRTVRCSRCRTITGDKDWWRLALRMRDVWGTTGGRDAWQ